MSHNYCIKSSALRSATSTCNGHVRLYSCEEARSCGYRNEVFLCYSHFVQLSRKQICCFPFQGPCSATLVDCPTRFFPIFDNLNSNKISSKICKLHLNEADSLDEITQSQQYEQPKSRKVGKFIHA